MFKRRCLKARYCAEIRTIKSPPVRKAAPSLRGASAARCVGLPGTGTHLCGGCQFCHRPAGTMRCQYHSVAMRDACPDSAPFPLEERGYVAGRSSAIGESLYRTCFNFRRRVPAGCMVADGVGHDSGRIRQLYFFDLKGAPEEFQIQRNTELVPACRCPH